MSLGKRILLVDDEAKIVEMTAVLLRRQGYRVTTAGSADSAFSTEIFEIAVNDPLGARPSTLTTACGLTVSGSFDSAGPSKSTTREMPSSAFLV